MNYIHKGEVMAAQNTDYFLAIVEEGSLTKAAERLYISQPSLSQYLKRLETSLNAELFDHSSSPLRLTYTGQRYYEYVLEVKRLDQHIKQEIEDIRNEKSGRIRLGVAFWRGACFLPEVFPEFHRQFPDIRIELTEEKSIMLQKELLDEHIDISIANIGNDMNYDKFSVEVFKRERILFAMPTHHPLTSAILRNAEYVHAWPKFPFSQLEKIPLILTTPGQNLTRQVQAFFAARNISPNILMETSNLTTAINLVACGMGAAFVPEEGAHICHHDGAVTFFTLDDPELTWDLAAIYKKGAYVSHVCRQFIDFSKQLIK